MKLCDLKNKFKDDPYFKSIALFLDKEGNINYVVIRIDPNSLIALKSFDENMKQTGYINIYFHPNKRLFLDTIYCYDDYRGKGIAGNLSEIVDFILKDYSNYIIRGEYNPSQLSSDRENNIYCSKKELETRADNFYRHAGYDKIHYTDYVKNPSKYPDININDDFQLGEEISDCIIVKKIIQKENYHFKELNNLIVSEKIIDFLDIKNDEVKNYKCIR